MTEPPPHTERIFPHSYFLKQSHQQEINQKGFTVIRSGVPATLLDQLWKAYQELQLLPGFSVGESFQNSGRFRSPEVRSFVMNAICKVSEHLLPVHFNQEVYDPNTTGAFQIKPPSKKSSLNPHQDSPVIDELHHNAVYVWIPMQDITHENGPVYVLPGSHLWGNHQRSLNVPWPFAGQLKNLWRYMEPVVLQKGDMLCWDTALIHASSNNASAKLRLAITTTLLPKNFTMVDYYRDKQTPSGMIEKYEVERSFWESGDIEKRPPVPPNRFIGFEPSVYPGPVSGRMLHRLAASR
ncbi:MAG: phytanoyl-CoA dioxygenase family protein [Chitinophagales bacterium]